jgi:hypothetical protein
MRKNCDFGGLASLLASLPGMRREELLEQWYALYDGDPPFKISQQLLIQAIAYRMQEHALGGLKPSTRRFLAKAAEEIHANQKITTPPATIKSGTRLIREWRGKIHEVMIVEEGVLFQGRQYRSLSEVARLITGVKWSGPLFFGLKVADKARAA